MLALIATLSLLLSASVTSLAQFQCEPRPPLNVSVTTLAGTLLPGAADGIGSQASFNTPLGLANYFGILYVADAGNNVVRVITGVLLHTVRTLAGSPTQLQGYADGLGSSASFYFPSGLAVDETGTIFVADAFNHIIRRVTPLGNVSTATGIAGVQGGDDGTAATFEFPLVVCTNSVFGDTLYVGDRNGIRVVTLYTDATVVTTLKGTQDTQYFSSTGVAAYSFESLGHLYYTDGCTLRMVFLATGVVVTSAGGPCGGGQVDGWGRYASFQSPQGLATDSRGTLIISDADSIRTLDVMGCVTTLAGNSSTRGHADGTAATFHGPTGIVEGLLGTYFISDTGNNLIRMLALSSPPYPSASPTVSTSPSVTTSPSATNTSAPVPFVPPPHSALALPVTALAAICGSAALGLLALGTYCVFARRAAATASAASYAQLDHLGGPDDSPFLKTLNS